MSARGTIWNDNQLNSNFIHPKRSVGEVVFNAKINGCMVVQGTHNRTPIWPLPNGQALEMMRKTRRGDIVWAYTNEYQTSNLMKSSSTHSNVETDTIEGLVSINGHGQNKEENHDFMSRIYPIGIASIPNDKNETDRFMCQFGGIVTTINNGSQRINAGDYVRAYAPSLDERLEGGRGEEVDKNGVMTLWYMPYKPEDHRWTTRNIQRSLLADRGTHTDAFKKASVTLIQQLIRTSVIVQSVMGSTAALKNNWDELVRASGNAKQSDNIISKLTTDEKTNILNVLVPALCEDDNRTKLQSPISTMLISQAWLVKNQLKNVLGKAVTSADPRKNFEIELCGYAK